MVGSRPGRAIPKALKMVIVAPLLMLALKKGCARKINEGKYPLLVMSQKKLMS